MSYCTIDQAKSAGASGTDTEIQDAIDQAQVVIDLYCRETFQPTTTILTVWANDGTGRLNRWAASVDTGVLDADGRTWHPDDLGCGEYLVSADIGSRQTPVAVGRAAARLAAIYSPAPFTAQTDSEGNPTGRPPAPTQQDATDPSPPQHKAGQPVDQTGGAPNERTTGDLIADAWLEPYKTNRVMV